MTEEKRDWKGKTSGAGWMHRSLIWMMRNLPLCGMYVFVNILIIPFCMIFSHKGYLSMYHFFRFRRHEGWFKAFWHTYQNHCKFAEIILDRFYVYAGGTFDFDIPDYEEYLKLARGKEGFVVLSAHIGNYEAAGYTLVAETKRFNALVYAGEAETVMENRQRMFEGNNLHMILIRKDMSHLFEISNALAEGESVSIPADRIFGSNRHFDIDFMGAQASFPMGPFAIAAQREVPVITIHVMKESARKYRIYIKRLDTTDGQNIKVKARQLAEQYADYLQYIVERYPTQWFNYFEFWNK
ncbi:LpxL/LpxP family acyltransferase [Segatella albensis]|uniref:LpxL/LpxP family acyltransferase n=1 Tax=Segatella albensis TaxID=77768 RepID=UPI0003F8DF66|nr:lysophospholipid acyltransferase family protein [Segatella albensis]